MPALFVGLLFVAIMVVLTIIAHRHAEARRKELSAWALSHRWSFSPDNDKGMDERYGDFSALRTGSDRYAYNIVSGRHGERFIRAFDYHYETHSTDSKGHRQTHHHQFSAVVIETGLPLRPLAIRTENFLDRIGEFLGFDDIDFELDEFNRAFHVKSPDRRWAFDVLHQKAMELLLESPRFAIEMAKGNMIVHRDQVFSAQEFDQALTLGSGLLDMLPRSVVRELRDSEGVE